MKVLKLTPALFTCSLHFQYPVGADVASNKFIDLQNVVK